MPSNTGAPHEYPYMVDGDPLADVADIMQTLAQRVAELEGQRGVEPIPVAAAASGLVTITFPIPFAAVPHMQVTSDNTLMLGAVDTITTTGCRLAVRHVNNLNVTGTYNVMWRAYPAST